MATQKSLSELWLANWMHVMAGDKPAARERKLGLIATVNCQQHAKRLDAPAHAKLKERTGSKTGSGPVHDEPGAREPTKGSLPLLNNLT